MWDLEETEASEEEKKFFYFVKFTFFLNIYSLNCFILLFINLLF